MPQARVFPGWWKWRSGSRVAPKSGWRAPVTVRLWTSDFLRTCLSISGSARQHNLSLDTPHTKCAYPASYTASDTNTIPRVYALQHTHNTSYYPLVYVLGLARMVANTLSSTTVVRMVLGRQMVALDVSDHPQTSPLVLWTYSAGDGVIPACLSARSALSPHSLAILSFASPLLLPPSLLLTTIQPERIAGGSRPY